MHRPFQLVLMTTALVVLGACGSEATQQPSEPTINVKHGVTGTAKVARATGVCDFYDGTLRPGDPVLVRAGDGTILGKTELTLYKVYTNPGADTPYRDLCAYDFAIDGLKANEPVYHVTIGDFGPVVVSKAEMETTGPFSLRDPYDVAAGKTETLEAP